MIRQVETEAALWAGAAERMPRDSILDHEHSLSSIVRVSQVYTQHTPGRIQIQAGRKRARQRGSAETTNPLLSAYADGRNNSGKGCRRTQRRAGREREQRPTREWLGSRHRRVRQVLRRKSEDMDMSGRRGKG